MSVDHWSQIHAHTSWTREDKDIIAAVNQAKNAVDGRVTKITDGADCFSEYEATRANTKDERKRKNQKTREIKRERERERESRGETQREKEWIGTGLHS